MSGGLSFGAPTEGEIVIAEEIAKIMLSVEQLRLVSSGTEATMTAIRLAAFFFRHSWENGTRGEEIWPGF